mgnify:CR=1 FL=1|tara:strand:- start:87 stop:674 length:588 start_codon:yes stop_codon:yes gene_type:complete
MNQNKKTKKQYILDFFKNHPGKKYKLKEIDEIVKAEYQKNTGSIDIYVNRSVRALGTQGYIPELEGVIEKPDRGSYLFRSGEGRLKPKSPFKQNVKEKIKKRDNYQCQWCKTKETNLDPLAIDHIIPEDKGGKGVLENGITLCTICNNRKKNLNASTFGKNMFEKYLVISKKNNDTKAVNFLKAILDIYKEHGLE